MFKLRYSWIVLILTSKTCRSGTTVQSNKFYVTTPIYYVNAKPHIGHLYSTLLADIMARWNRLQGKEVCFVTGLDEHGQKIATAAEAAGIAPQAFVDSMVSKFNDVWSRFNIEYNNFIRTTDTEHKAAVQSLIQTLLDRGHIYKSSYVGAYCTPCETFVNPQEARAADVASAEILCLNCGRATKEIAEESYFFKLASFQEKLLEFYAANPNFIQPKERLNEVVSFVRSGLRDLSFSRKSVKWGIPFPGDSEHTVYVWGDALTNYISAIGYNQNAAEFLRLWPADLHIMAKDIVRFHAVYWPAILMATGLALPKRMLVHGYILQDAKKMSKSIGNVIDPMQLADWYGTESVRYYFARTIPTTQDGSFALSELEECARADLANNLGNLLSRTVALALKNNLQQVQNFMSSEFDVDCESLLKNLMQECKKIVELMEQNLIHLALAEICKQLSLGNALFHKLEPWKLAKINPLKFEQVIWTELCLLKVCATLLWPVIPNKAKELLTSIGVTLDFNQNILAVICDFQTQQFKLVALPSALFEKPIEHSKLLAENNVSTEVEPVAATEGFANFDDLLKIKMAIGKIVSAEAVEKSDKLLKLVVDFGQKIGTRQVISGIAQHYKPEETIGHSAAFVINLQPRKIMGLESQAMILCAGNNDKTQLAFLSPEKSINVGAEIG